MTKSPDIQGPRTYEMIAFFKGSDADPFFHALLERGPKHEAKRRDLIQNALWAPRSLRIVQGVGAKTPE